jgi:hypothetical protein
MIFYHAADFEQAEIMGRALQIGFSCDINVICTKKLDSQLAEIIFGPYDTDDKILVFSGDRPTWQHLAKAMGLFPSTSEAMRHGLNGEIPFGCTEKIISLSIRHLKRKIRFYIWREIAA